MTGYVVISEVDALMYVVLTKAEGLMRNYVYHCMYDVISEVVHHLRSL
jgi:hypothetical protein